MSKNKQVVIHTKHLTKCFGDKEVKQTILNDVNVELYEGDFTVIMGSSGAGKSTLLYALSGMDRPTSGMVEWYGEDITQFDDQALTRFRKTHCGFVFQQIYLLDQMSLMDNVLTAGLLTNKNKKEVIAHAKRLFEEVQLPEITQKKTPNQISGGEAQRAGIVRAVIHEPDVVFADEPTGALNSSTSDAILDVFTQLHQQKQTIIMVTHDVKTALRANRILYMKDGFIYGECDLQEYDPNDPTRLTKLQAFLDEMGW